MGQASVTLPHLPTHVLMLPMVCASGTLEKLEPGLKCLQEKGGGLIWKQTLLECGNCISINDAGFVCKQIIFTGVVQLV